jgi:hypothetical protein
VSRAFVVLVLHDCAGAFVMRVSCEVTPQDGAPHDYAARLASAWTQSVVRLVGCGAWTVESVHPA